MATRKAPANEDLASIYLSKARFRVMIISCMWNDLHLMGLHVQKMIVPSSTSKKVLELG